MTMHDRDSMRKGWIAFILMSSAVGAAAYAGRPGVRNGDSQVWGRVTVQGMPVKDGTVVLKPVVDRNATWGSGLLDHHGRFHLEGSRSDVPLLPGRYHLYLCAPTRVDYALGRPVALAGFPVPQKYLDPMSPVIQVEIDDQPIHLDLKLDD